MEPQNWRAPSRRCRVAWYENSRHRLSPEGIRRWGQAWVDAAEMWLATEYLLLWGQNALAFGEQWRCESPKWDRSSWWRTCFLNYRYLAHRGKLVYLLYDSMTISRVMKDEDDNSSSLYSDCYSINPCFWLLCLCLETFWAQISSDRFDKCQ